MVKVATVSDDLKQAEQGEMTRHKPQDSGGFPRGKKKDFSQRRGHAERFKSVNNILFLKMSDGYLSVYFIINF